MEVPLLLNPEPEKPEQDMLAEHKTLLLDTSLYPRSSFIEAAMAEDLGGMAIENGDLPTEKRINQRRFLISNGGVIDPLTGKGVLENISYKSELDRSESAGTRDFYQKLIDGPARTLVISVSPPEGDSPYKDGRVNVGFKVSEGVIHFYGIVTKFTREQCLYWCVRATEFSDSTIPTNEPNDLRKTAFNINVPEGNPWLFMEEFAPLDSPAWKEISEGKPWLLKREVKQNSLVVAQRVAPLLKIAKTREDFILIGAFAEREMARKGWKLNASGGCPGVLNSDLLGGNYKTDSFGNNREVMENSFPCPKCGQPIPSGRGITTCPHCGITKEEAGSTCA